MENLNQNFRDFIGLIKEEKVEYLLVGGYAVGLHGYPRYTGDIDFFVAVSPGNAAKLVRVFEKFGFADLGLVEQDFLRENYVVEIGREPNKIQILTGIDGVTFDECYSKRLSLEIDDLPLEVIAKEDLILNKAASGRPKDKLDLEELRKT